MRLIDLTPLHEIDFRNQAAFDTYNKQHKLRPDTKVNVAGKNTTAGKAAQSSTPVKGTSVFGKDKGGDKKYPSFSDPLEGFPTEYKELLKKLQRSNDSDERTQLINKMNIIRKNIKLKPLTKDLESSVFGGDKKPFSGGVDVLDTVQKLLPVGTGFTDKKTGNKILIKGYKGNDMLVSHDKYPNKMLKWPLKQFFKLDTKRFQFHPKPKEKTTI